VGNIKLDNQQFSISLSDEDARGWIEAVYAFVINDEIVRVGSSKNNFQSRMSSWSYDVSTSLSGDYRNTPKIESDLWREELATFGAGTIWARLGTTFLSPIHDEPISAYQDEETILIQRHKPRLNRGAHR
jgi:hypothetical protein